MGTLRYKKCLTVLSKSLVFLGLYSCSGNVEIEQKHSQATQLNESQQKDMLDQASKDADPSLQDSFESLSNLQNSINDLVGQNNGDNSSLVAEKLLDDSPIINFEYSDDVDTEYSDPVMITGASLHLTSSNEEVCGALQYQKKAPSMKSLFSKAKDNGLCGETTINICMRMSLKSVSINKSFVFRKLPQINISLPCSEDSFEGADFAVKTVSYDESSVGIDIEAKRVVTFMKLFNSDSCNSPKSWSEIVSTSASLPVSWKVDGTSSVSLKLKDSYGYESDCISQVIVKSELEKLPLAETSTETYTYSDTYTDTFTDTNISCLDDEVDLIAANIKKGVSVGGVTGTAELSQVLCTSDGQLNCIATDAFAAVESSQLVAANFKSGSTVGGVAGTTVVETRSDCASDGEESCIANVSFKSALVTGLAAKIVSGQTVAGVAGTAVSQKSDCNSDGQQSCIATSTYKSALSSGLASKVVQGQTVAGVAGITAEETGHSDCTGAGQSGCLATSNYKTMDLSSADSGGALDLSSSNFDARLTSSSVFEYWDDLGVRHTNSGDSDLLAGNLDWGVDIFGVVGAGNQPKSATACDSIGTAGTWVLVPGDPDYGTSDFCVMKYEAKNNGSGIPESKAADTPWRSISWHDAVTKCAAIGKGYHLISNDEWMTIAANVAAVDNNWTGGTVGSGRMYQGHNDARPYNTACPADVDDTKAYVEDNCTGETLAGSVTTRRTHYLSNGNVVWDMSGNFTAEWIHYYIDSDIPTHSSRYYNSMTATDTLPRSDFLPTMKSFWQTSWETTYTGIGTPQFYGNYAYRGGHQADSTYHGIFAFGMGGSAANGQFGFRCTVAAP